MKKMRIEVIFSFAEDEQKITCLEFDFRPSEAQFLWRALRVLTTSEQAGLYKISACQVTEDLSQALPWILKSNGKYFFSVEVGE